VNAIIEKLIEERNVIDAKILTAIIPEDVYEEIYIKHLLIQKFYGSAWFIKNNIAYIGDEFDIKDFFNKGKKIKKLLKLDDIFYLKKDEVWTCIIEYDHDDFCTIYILDNDLEYNETYEKRMQDSWNKLVESIKADDEIKPIEVGNEIN